jgi:hypothetical protein
MSRYVCDTLPLVLHLERRKLPAGVKKCFELAEKGDYVLLVPSVVVEEIDYLCESGIISLNITEVEDYLKRYSSIRECPMDKNVSQKTFEITDIVQLHDKLVAGTGCYFNIPIITNDPAIQQSKFVSTYWE